MSKASHIAPPTEFSFSQVKISCLDVQSTIMFYETLGMQNSLKKEEHLKDGKKIVLGFAYPQQPDVYLIFETKKDAQLKSSTEKLDKNYKLDASKSAVHLSPEYVVIYVQLLSRIYTMLVAKGFKLILSPVDVAETKMVIFQDPNGLQVRLQEVSEIHSKMSIQQSMNAKTSAAAAIKQKKQTNIQQSKKWVGRLGYYCLPTMDIHKTVHFYSLLLSYAKSEIETAIQKNQQDYVPSLMKGAQQGDLKKLDISRIKGGEAKANQAEDWSKANASTDASILQKLKLGGAKKPGSKYLEMRPDMDIEGFKVVDTEDFLIGLSRTFYAWMSNGPRPNTFSVCFVEKLDAGDIKTPTDYDNLRKTSPFFSFVFQVRNMDAGIDRMRTRVKNLRYESERSYVPGWGVYQDIIDSVNNIKITLFCHKSDYEQYAKRGDKLLEIIRKVKTETGSKEAPERLTNKLKYQYEINMNHLSGMARTMSEGAIVAKRIDGQDDDNGQKKTRGKWYDRLAKTSKQQTLKKNPKLALKDKPKSKSTFL